MREINNNVDFAKLQNTELKSNKVEKSEPQSVEKAEEDAIKDFSNPTEVLGRSQVSKSDNLSEDVNFAIANPDAVASADKFFDMAYAQLKSENDPNAYEKASTMASIYAKEICAK